MHSDKDLPFGDLDQLPLDDDPRRLAARNAAAQIKQKQQKPAASQVSKPRPEVKPAQAKSSASLLPWVLLAIVLVVALVGGYWFANQLKGMQANMTALQTQAADQLDSLHHSLSATSDATNAEQGKILNDLGAINKELTRLAANDLATRRRVSALEASDKQVQAGIKQLDTLKKQLATLQQSLASLEAKQKADASIVSRLEVKQDLLVSTNKELTNNILDQKKRIDQMGDSSKQITQLQKDINEVQASINAFDQWRAQVNSKLY